MNDDQGETYNGNVFELPMTWVTKCPEKGALTVTYSRFKLHICNDVLRTHALRSREHSVAPTASSCSRLFGRRCEAAWYSLPIQCL